MENRGDQIVHWENKSHDTFESFVRKELCYESL